jgi:hypothetical protein
MSSHDSQHAAHERERSRRVMHSPEGRRTPAESPLPPAQLQRFPNLPDHLAQQFAALTPLSRPHTRHAHHSHTTDPSVSFSHFSTLKQMH